MRTAATVVALVLALLALAIACGDDGEPSCEIDKDCEMIKNPNGDTALIACVNKQCLSSCWTVKDGYIRSEGAECKQSSGAGGTCKKANTATPDLTFCVP